jgi:succinate-semialdehyde dehydrogenase/glutarate-semialdehyde dehydrogenase
MPFESAEEILPVANQTRYGLAASIWTRNRARGERLARRIVAGTVLVNDAVSCFGISEAPHGGVKASGIGRTHGRFGFDEMVRVKYLGSDRLPGVKKPWWYSYGDTLPRQIEGFLDLEFAKRVSTRVAGALRSATLWFRRDRL